MLHAALITKIVSTLQSQEQSWLKTSCTLIPNNIYIHRYIHTKKTPTYKTKQPTSKRYCLLVRHQMGAKLHTTTAKHFSLGYSQPSPALLGVRDAHDTTKMGCRNHVGCCHRAKPCPTPSLLSRHLTGSVIYLIFQQVFSPLEPRHPQKSPASSSKPLLQQYL